MMPIDGAADPALRRECELQKPENASPRNATIAAGRPRPESQAALAIAEFEALDPAQVAYVTKLLKNSAILIEAREFRLALNLLRDLLIRVPESSEGLMRMGICLRELGRYDESLKCFRALLKTDCDRKFEAQVLLAETFYLGERDEMALAAYREVLKAPVADRRTLFDIYKNLGNIHVRGGDFDSAEEYYDKAHTLNPDSDVLMVNYGTLEIQKQNFANAVQRFRRAVEINPESDKGWIGLAMVHRQMGDFDLSWANVQRALDINSTNRTAIRLVVEWAVADQRFTIAVTRLQEYLEADGEDAEMSFMLAKIFTQLGRLQEARIEMARVLALDPMIEGGVSLASALDRELAQIARSEQL